MNTTDIAAADGYSVSLTERGPGGEGEKPLLTDTAMHQPRRGARRPPHNTGERMLQGEVAADGYSYRREGTLCEHSGNVIPALAL